LSESEVKTGTVLIPGELRLSNPVPPPIVVALPIVAWPHGLKNFLLGLLALTSGLLLLSAGVLSAITIVAVALGASDISWSVWNAFVSFVVLPLSVFFGVSFGVGFTGAALTCFWDAVRSGPVLEIAADGLRDHRSGLLVLWSSVGSARLRGGLGSVDLRLRSPVRNWQNPFRAGILYHRYRPIPDQVLVSIAHLDVRAHILAYSILTLTQWNGGEATSKTPGALDTGLKLIPRGARANDQSPRHAPV
jgi:hypothetical protein